MTKIPHQFYPLAVIFILLIAALIIFRYLLIPETFGKYGHYRAATIDEIRSQEIAYAGYQACYDCHDDIFETKRLSPHENIACEACHGPAAEHIEAPDEITPRIPRNRDYCLLCHRYNPARPSGFPQIISNQHNPGQACMTCHNPHNPTPPHTPEECSACHRVISLELSVSHHTSLHCTRCHSVPEQHKNNPRLVRAEKPTSKQTCGACHSRMAESDKSIPRIDLETHGGRYKCWDCHYPHYPEAR